MSPGNAEPGRDQVRQPVRWPISTSPSEPTATQKVGVGHDTEERPAGPELLLPFTFPVGPMTLARFWSIETGVDHDTPPCHSIVVPFAMTATQNVTVGHDTQFIWTMGGPIVPTGCVGGGAAFASFGRSGGAGRGVRGLVSAVDEDPFQAEKELTPTAMQKLGVGHDTRLGTVFTWGVENDVPFHVTGLPVWPTAMQKVDVGHEMEWAGT